MNYEFFYRWQLVRILEKIFLLEFIFSCMDGSDKKLHEIDVNLPSLPKKRPLIQLFVF